MGEKILHSRESGNLPFLPPLAGNLFLPAFGGGFAPKALESGDSRFRGNGKGGGMGGWGVGDSKKMGGMKKEDEGNWERKFSIPAKTGISRFCRLWRGFCFCPPLAGDSRQRRWSREIPAFAGMGIWGNGDGGEWGNKGLKEDFQLIHRYQLQ